MAARLVRTHASNLNGSGSVSVKSHPGHLLGSIPTFFRRFCAQSEESSDSKIRFVVRLKLPPGKEELSSNAEEKEKWYHSFISGGKRSGVGSDKDPRIVHACKRGHGVGFSALLTREEALALKEYDGFVCAKPEKAYPSPLVYRRRPKIEVKENSLFKDLDLHIYASDEIKEKLMAGPIKREYMMRDGEGEATLHST